MMQNMSTAKVAIVTGGSRGIGAQISFSLLQQGFHVVIADVLSPAKQKNSSKFLFVKTDVSEEHSVKKMIEKTLAHFGQIDVLVNNAGILPEEFPSFDKISLKLWNQFLSVNLTGAFLCSKYAIPHIRKKKGAIIHIASTRALQSEGNDSPYAASKGGLVALSRAMAMELGPDVRVNSISPGWIDTGKWSLSKKDHTQHPAGRLGKPEDIAHLVAFLISDKAGFITGQNYIIDGGMTSKMIYA